MKFSLITATLGRVSEFERLLQSLSAQTFKEKNGDDRIPSFLNKVGLSKNIYTLGAKNKGLSWVYDVEKVQTKLNEIRNEAIGIIDNMIGKNGTKASA